MASPITCHVLDSSLGLPAEGISISLTIFKTPEEVLDVYPDTDDHLLDGTLAIGSGQTNADGRCLDLAHPEDLQEIGIAADYMICFETKEYFEKQGKQTFYPKVEIHFTIPPGDEEKHFHIPLLISPYSYTTYRGS